MKPNKLQDCKRGASAWDGMNIPEEINENEKRDRNHLTF